jgi:hypothetical protein
MGQARLAPQRPEAKPHYVICLIDACSRLAWAEVVAAKKALPVMFKALKMINTLHLRYGVVFIDILRDNGAEFAARAHPNEHPLEAMLLELGVRNRCRPTARSSVSGAPSTPISSKGQLSTPSTSSARSSSNTSFITTNSGATKRLPVKPPSRLRSSSHQN